MEDWTVSWVSEIDHQKAPCRIWTSCNHVVETRCPMISRIPYVGRHAMLDDTLIFFIVKMYFCRL
jgi:hypothetical protein